MTPPMMKCGHAANAIDGANRPCCAICAMVHGDAARTVDTSPPDLTGRAATCAYCGSRTPSSARLAFFKHTPSRPMDDYYCGCRGWD